MMIKCARLASALAAALLLAGCFVSDRPFVTRPTDIADLEPGSYTGFALTSDDKWSEMNNLQRARCFTKTYGEEQRFCPDGGEPAVVRRLGQGRYGFFGGREDEVVMTAQPLLQDVHLLDQASADDKGRTSHMAWMLRFKGRNLEFYIPTCADLAPPEMKARQTVENTCRVDDPAETASIFQAYAAEIESELHSPVFILRLPE